MSAPLRNLLLVLAALLAAMLGAWTAKALFDRKSAPLHATVLQPPRALPELALIDHRGQPFDRDRLRGQWSVLFFGFSNCPDVCPMTMRTLAGAMELLRERGETAPQVVFISVDPERDSIERLAQYVPYFDTQFIGVTGAKQDIEALTQALGVAVAVQLDDSNPSRYTIDHTSALFLTDPQGRLRALFSAPHQARVIADEYDAITSG